MSSVSELERSPHGFHGERHPKRGLRCRGAAKEHGPKHAEGSPTAGLRCQGCQTSPGTLSPHLCLRAGQNSPPGLSPAVPPAARCALSFWSGAGQTQRSPGCTCPGTTRASTATASAQTHRAQGQTAHGKGQRHPKPKQRHHNAFYSALEPADRRLVNTCYRNNSTRPKQAGPGRLCSPGGLFGEESHKRRQG